MHLAGSRPSPTLRAPPSVRGGSPLSRSTVSRVLVVDDEELYRRALERILLRAGHEVILVGDAQEALSAVSTNALDLVLCDWKMPGIDGLELIRQIRELEPDLPCILITGHGSARASVDALAAGAFWYLEKPFEQSHLDVIRGLVHQAIEFGRLRSENRALHGQLRAKYKFESIVGKSAALRNVLETVEKVADTDSTVLITGDSGTGKELVARALHYNSRRASFVDRSITGELWSHPGGAARERALRPREGCFHQRRRAPRRPLRGCAASGGTIFLDEIGDMSPTLQVKLLRVLQERTFEPVGSSKTQHVDVRVIAATNQDLEKLIGESVASAKTSTTGCTCCRSVCRRFASAPTDIPLLVHHFLDVANQDRGTSIDGVTDGAMEHLVQYEWPGNVRQLENLIERMAILQHSGDIDVDQLPPEVAQARRQDGRSHRESRRTGSRSTRSSTRSRPT